jgi:hypothetical protein
MAARNLAGRAMGNHGMDYAPPDDDLGQDLSGPFAERRWSARPVDDRQSFVALVDRLGKLEGLLIGLQNSISQGQAQNAAFMSRVERLESRQIELERNMVTKQDITSLVAKVDALATSDARQQGGTAVAKWSASNLVSWVAVLVSLITLAGVGIGRDPGHPSHRPTPQGSAAGR